VFDTLWRCLFHSLVKLLWYQKSIKMAPTKVSSAFVGGDREAGNGKLEERPSSDLALVKRFIDDSSESTIVGAEDERLKDGNFAVRKLEEYDIDFDDTRKFTVQRWGDIVKAAIATLSIGGNLFATPWMDLY
jgi:hypothetical protein